MNFPSEQHASELLEVFFESADELLEDMNRAGLVLETHPGDLENLRHLRRAVHTLKGDSAACGFREISELAHRLEDVLTPELASLSAAQIADVVLAAADVFREMLAAYRRHLPPPPVGELQELIQGLLEEHAPSAQSCSDQKPVWTEYERLLIDEACRNRETVCHVVLRLKREPPPTAAGFELARKALESSGRLLALNPQPFAPSAKISRIHAAVSTREASEQIKNRCLVPSVVEEVSIEGIDAAPPAGREALQSLLESEAAAVASSRRDARDKEKLADAPVRSGSSHAFAEASLRVDAARIDSVMNLVGELIIGKSMLQGAVDAFAKSHPKDPLRGRLSDAMSFQSRVLGELQKSVMKIRMVPVEQLFRRFPRVVRDVARLRNKEIFLKVSGEKTDLDKSILDALAEPVAHLVRNAADHGIEEPAIRQAAGKDARGTIRLHAYHEGDEVVIEVSDDGGGLDREKILRRAVERGLLGAEESNRLGEAEAQQLIFRPGFSTADQITEISGRGVGLDVVRAALDGLKGSVEVESVAGRGTTFRLLVPLTLASIQALLFRLRGRLYAVPIASVIEITRVADGEIHQVEDKEVFRLRNQLLLLTRLDQLGPRIKAEPAKRTFVVVISAGGRRFGLAVEGLVGEQELVIKAIEDHLVASPLISGASILGDGTVVLILNLAAVASQLTKGGPPGAAS